MSRSYRKELRKATLRFISRYEEQELSDWMQRLYQTRNLHKAVGCFVAGRMNRSQSTDWYTRHTYYVRKERRESRKAISRFQKGVTEDVFSTNVPKNTHWTYWHSWMI